MSEINDIMMLDISSSMPDYIKALPTAMQMTWKDAYNRSAMVFGFDKAVEIANRIVLKKLRQAQLNREIDTTPDIIELVSEENKERVSMHFEPSNEVLVSLSDDGEVILDAVLANGLHNKDGKKFSEGALKAMAEYINENGMALPDVDHIDYNELSLQYPNIAEFKEQLRKKKGIFKTVKAYFKEGKLFIKAFLDKRYRKIAQRYSNLSIEAVGITESTDPSTFVAAEPISFTFTNKPRLQGSDILSIN